MKQRYWMLATICLISIGLASRGAIPTYAADAGLQPGEKVPAFSLVDQDGKTQTLQSLSGPNGLLLLFNRSADWCPFCKSQLIDLETARHNFEAKGINVASITYDSQPILKAFWMRRGIHYSLLSDSDSAVIDAFGVRNHEAEAKGAKSGIAIPNYFLIAPDGTIQRRYAETELLDRVTASYLYETLYGSGSAQPGKATIELDFPQLKITLSQSDTSIAPGARTRLTVQLALDKGSHLYAPGAEAFGYHPVRLTLEPSDLYLAKPLVYGPSTILDVASLQEKVPTFESSTALIQDVWAVRSPKTNAEFRENPDVIVRGLLEYQMCTNTTCSAPEKKPVWWALHVSATDLDTIRVAEELQKK